MIKHMIEDPTGFSLADQMRIDEFEVSRRKELLNFEQEDIDLLTGVKPAILKNLEAIVEEFYERQRAIPEIAVTIGDQETLRRLRDAQRSYIVDLFSGYYDLDYVNNRLRIGLVHKRIGVEPKFYLSAIASLKVSLNEIVDEALRDSEAAAKTRRALDKLLYFDNELVFDTYIRSLMSEIQMSRDKATQHTHNLEAKIAERTEQLAKLSRIDSLTGLMNKRTFLDELRLALARGKRASSPVALLYIDLDDFKSINDSQGHLRGDDILRNFGRTVHGVARETDLCGRYGGDEFCIALPDTNSDQAKVVLQRLRVAAMDEVSVSVGMAVSGPETHYDVDQLVQHADRSMYAMKTATSNTTELPPPGPAAKAQQNSAAIGSAAK